MQKNDLLKSGGKIVRILGIREGQPGADLLSVSREELILTLLPRVQGKFTRQGLKVNGMRYKNGNYMEKYLSGLVNEYLSSGKYANKSKECLAVSIGFVDRDLHILYEK